MVLPAKSTAALFSILLLSAACSIGRADVAPTRTPARQAQRERSIVVVLSQTPTTLDPADHRDRPSETVIRNVFDGLVTRDTRNRVYPELADELNWLDDQTLEISLRRGVLFHDGVEMTADDVVFTFERIMQPDGLVYPTPHDSPRQGLLGPLQSVEKKDDYTVVMHFSAPWPPAMQLLVHQQIVPKHYIEQIGMDGFAAHPIGTGPFKFVEASQGFKEIILERFAEYYGGAPDLAPVGPACVERVVFRVITDPATRIAALLIEEADLIQGMSPDLVERLEQNPKILIKTAPGTQPKWVELNVTRPPFDDVQVRRALNFAVDKEQLIEEAFGGRAVPLAGPLSPFNGFASQALEPYPYDPQAALELLAGAGWTDSDGDGLLDQNGTPFRFVLDTLPEWYTLATVLSAQWRQVGIEASVRTWEPSLIQPELLARRRIAYLDDWGDSAFDPVGHIEAKWHGLEPDADGQARYGRGNYSGYNNVRVNELIRRGEVTADVSERHRIYDEAQRIIYEDAPAVFLVLPEEVEAASVRLQNWEPASDGRANLHDVCITP